MRSAQRNGEAGFTLLELLIAMMVSGLVLSALGTGFIAASRATIGAHDRFVESHDAELLATYFPSDVQSADPLLVTWQDKTTPTGCLAAPPAGTVSYSVLRLQWTEVDDALSTKKAFSASYRIEKPATGNTWALLRYYCAGSGSRSSSTDGILTSADAATKTQVQTVAHDLDDADVKSPTVASDGRKLSLTLYSHKASSESSAYSWTISASTRSIGNTTALVPTLKVDLTTSAPVAGAADSLTITALDLNGNINTTYSGFKDLTFSGPSPIGSFNPTITNRSGAPVNFGSLTSINFTNGVATVSGSNNGVMKLYRAEPVAINVTDNTINNNPGSPVDVKPAQPLNLTLTAATITPGVGDPDNLTITSGLDQYGNTSTNYTGLKNLTFSGAGSVGSNNPTVTDNSGTPVNFGQTTAVAFTNGVATVSGANNGVMRLYKAETAHITVTDGTINNGTGLVVTVSAGSATALLLAAATVTPVAGATDSLTITATDSSGNPATGYGGDHDLIFSGAGSIGGNNPTATNKTGSPVNFGLTTAVAFTNGVATVSGANNGVMRLYKAETAHITVTDGTINNGTGLVVTVSAGTSQLTFTSCSLHDLAPTLGPCGAQHVGSNGHVDFHISIKDASGNPTIASGSTVTITVGRTAGSSNYTLPNPATLTMTWPQTETSGTLRVTYAGTAGNTSADFTAQYGSLSAIMNVSK